MLKSNEPIKSDLNQLYSTRLILLIENSPQSNKYWQLILDKDEFKKLSDLVESFGEKEKCNNCPNDHIVLDLDDSYAITLPSEIKDINIHEPTTNIQQ